MRSNFLFAVAALLAATPAAGAVTAVGNSYARSCFEAAEARGAADLGDLRACDQALQVQGLSQSETVATFVNRGILKARIGRVEDAIRDYDSALRHDPDQAEAYLNKGFALLHLPAAERQAKPMFDTAIAKNTRRPELAYYGRAVAHELTGEVQAAYRDYRKASAIKPNWRQPKEELARFRVN